jgi:hypothetical protein
MTASSDSSSYWVRSSIGPRRSVGTQLGGFERAQVLSGAEREVKEVLRPHIDKPEDEARKPHGIGKLVLCDRVCRRAHDCLISGSRGTGRAG